MTTVKPPPQWRNIGDGEWRLGEVDAVSDQLGAIADDAVRAVLGEAANEHFTKELLMHKVASLAVRMVLDMQQRGENNGNSS